ncbi:MAG: phosphate propanoyltransferase [Bacilli bacterium]|nr:phosphate propanoyltransferase [Bacilli bacterium]
MNIKVPVGISNRHVHLTKEVYEELFDEELTLKNELNQPGEFASIETLTIKTPKGSIGNVRVLGPFRNYNQVEISKSDAYVLGLNPPVRTSGDLENSEKITLINGDRSITLENACIIANRHIHMNPEKALSLGVTNNQLVNVKIAGDKSGVVTAFVKITENGYFEMHIDRDDANAFLLNNNDEVEVLL